MRNERGRYDQTQTTSPGARIRGEDYLAYRPLMLQVLGRLARDGYVVPPDDGLDLVHDFFVEAWPAVITRYDADKAKFRTYLHLSFASFARPRIVKLTRWRTTLVDPHDIPRLHGWDDSVEAQQERSPDTYLVEAVVRSLARHDRIIFDFYIKGAGSEREIASHLGITRYRLRSKLADIFGSVAVKIGDMSAFPEPVPSVVIALWRDNRTAKEAASYLKITVPEVQAVRNRMFRLLAETMKGSGNMAVESVRTPDTGASEAVDVQALLERVAGTSSETRDRAMDEIRRHADAVLAYFEGRDADLPMDPSDAETYAEIYFALAGEEDGEALREAELPYVTAYEREEVLIGEAFRQSLVPGLPKRLRDISTYFLGLAVLEPVEREPWLSDLTVLHGGPSAQELLAFGLTPAHLVTAAHAIASLARREGDRIGLGLGSAIRIADVAAGGDVVSLDQATDQVALVAELDGELARRVTRWLLEVAGFVPLLFDDFVAEADLDGLALRLTDETEDDFLLRWKAIPLESDVSFVTGVPVRDENASAAIRTWTRGSSDTGRLMETMRDGKPGNASFKGFLKEG
ncbi:sigma-70 family RNA polymerase sigma factor [Methylobacterium sp. 285MFTsu5.1]|uniref:sigma-70 family RNA polymerase sigma factor n=1 Tax=Methylobacterium sp. 285MFTsu5.1 TaxID=1172187 RepID=UPI0003A453DD|nr:sigma-70 family RNA polymerase sigma factor [Methylobacterium sp. 285MFTsu5.1]